MKTKVENLNITDNSRLLFISDVHGNLDGFKRVLEKGSFTKDDYLFVIGDIIEKGDQCIELLDYIFQLKQEGYKVYCVMGNCEELLSLMKPPVNKSKLLNYVLTKKSILNEFAAKLNLKITKDSNLNTICWYTYKEFSKYYDFLLELPHIININDKITLVHGGIDDLDKIPSDPHNIMKYDSYYFKCKNRMKRITIVGHYPTINYHDDYPNSNPIIDLNKNIISIDGGNNVVPWGHLNLLIIDNINDMNISYITYDKYPICEINDNVTGNNLKLFNITPEHPQVEILSEEGDFYICRHKKTDNIIPILKLFVYFDEKKKEYFAYDAFNYMPTLHKNDRVDLVFFGTPYSIIKHNGIVGLIDSKYINRNI